MGSAAPPIFFYVDALDDVLVSLLWSHLFPILRASSLCPVNSFQRHGLVEAVLFASRFLWCRKFGAVDLCLRRGFSLRLRLPRPTSDLFLGTFPEGFLAVLAWAVFLAGPFFPAALSSWCSIFFFFSRPFSPFVKLLVIDKLNWFLILSASGQKFLGTELIQTSNLLCVVWPNYHKSVYPDRA